ncbi:MAG: hypothetical protein RSA60_06300 [Eubacterium sp.]
MTKCVRGIINSDPTSEATVEGIVAAEQKKQAVFESDTKSPIGTRHRINSAGLRRRPLSIFL